MLVGVFEVREMPIEDDVGLLDIVGQLAVVMLHGEVQRVDAAEIFRVEHMLRADPAAGRRAEIGLEDGSTGSSTETQGRPIAAQRSSIWCASAWSTTV